MAPFLVKRITESEHKQFLRAWTCAVVSVSVFVLGMIAKWMGV